MYNPCDDGLYNPCIGCEYYNNPYWSVENPCNRCPRINGTDGYVTTTTTGSLPLTIGKITFCSQADLFQWIEEQQKINEKYQVETWLSGTVVDPNLSAMDCEHLTKEHLQRILDEMNEIYD